MSWMKGVKSSADTSKYKGYKTGGFVKPETVTADPGSTKVGGTKAAPPAAPVGKAAKPLFGGAGKPFGKACGGPAGGQRRLDAQKEKKPF